METELFSDDDHRLLSAATQPGPGAWAAWRSWRAAHDLQRIDVARQLLLPSVHWNLRPWPGDDPDAGLLRGIARYFWSRNQLTIRVLRHALRALDQAGVEATVVDDAALALAYYEHPGLRPIEHLRLEISGNGLTEAMACLSDAKFIQVSRHGLGRLDRRPAFVAAEGRTIELRRKAARQADLVSGDQSRPFQAQGMSGYTLDPTCQLLRVLRDVDADQGQRHPPTALDVRQILRATGDEIRWGELFDAIESSAVLLSAPAILTYVERTGASGIPPRALPRLATLRAARRARVGSLARAAALRRWQELGRRLHGPSAWMWHRPARPGPIGQHDEPWGPQTHGPAN
jgi:hypothetical protein